MNLLLLKFLELQLGRKFNEHTNYCEIRRTKVSSGDIFNDFDKNDNSLFEKTTIFFIYNFFTSDS